MEASLQFSYLSQSCCRSHTNNSNIKPEYLLDLHESGWVELGDICHQEKVEFNKPVCEQERRTNRNTDWQVVNKWMFNQRHELYQSVRGGFICSLKRPVNPLPINTRAQALLQSVNGGFCQEMSHWPVGLCVTRIPPGNPTQPPHYASAHTQWTAEAAHLLFRRSSQTVGLLCGGCCCRDPLTEQNNLI